MDDGGDDDFDDDNNDDNNIGRDDRDNRFHTLSFTRGSAIRAAKTF
jgi:hypothetical protein